MNAEELLKKLDAERDAYVGTLLQLHEALARTVIASSLATPTLRTPSPRPVFDRVARLSLGESERKAAASLPATFKSSFISGEDDEASDDDEALYVQELLPTVSFDDEHLRSHLKKYQWNESSMKILESILTHEGRLKQPHLFPSGQDSIEYQSHYSLYQAFDVGSDGAPLPLHADITPRTVSKGEAMWHWIKDINVDQSKRQAVGRITILREPSPTLFAAIHLTMNELFDMDEIFSHLVQQETTRVEKNRAFSEDQRKQRSIVFSFEYFTITGDECQPMTWQQSDQERERPANHIPISRCCAVVALSLVGKPTKNIKNSHRRAKTEYGYVYSPWSPWHVLNIQCYPDWKSNTASHDSTKHYVNGPEAFLNTLLVEYKDAQKRFEEISLRVTKLITPPADFMFNGELRDKLLFEDAKFTYSRRYFWAFQTLGTMNQSIKAIIDAYEDTFTKDVWDGRHRTLWPLPEDNSSRNAYWRKRMASLKKDFEVEIQAFKVIISENEDRRKEIRNLRDNLFSGTSVLESRKSVEQTEITVQQGHNIKLLTLVNMFFLPLTFVTSVFGMTNMDPSADFWRFGVVMATVCVPFFLLIGSMNTNRGMRFWRNQVGNVFVYLFNFLRWTTGWKRKNHTNGKATENGEEISKKHFRSLSASEGMAQRLGQAVSVETGDPSPSPGNTVISSGQARSTNEESKPPQALSISSKYLKKGDEKANARPSSMLKQSASLPLQAPQPMMTTALSSAKTIAVNESTEVSNTQASLSNGAVQRRDLGLWGRLRPSRSRSVGGKEHLV